MPYPVNDVVAAMKHYPERVQSSLSRIQDLLLRNVNVNHASSEQQFRLQKVMTNSAQQVLDKVAGISFFELFFCCVARRLLPVDRSGRHAFVLNFTFELPTAHGLTATTRIVDRK